VSGLDTAPQANPTSRLYNGCGGAERGIGHEVLRTVQHQRIGDTVLFGVLRYIALEEAEVEDMNFRIVLHGKLREGVAVGVFHEQEFAALSAARNDSLRLIGVQKHGILVAAIKIWA